MLIVCQMFAVIYFSCKICMCVLAVLATIVVLRLNLHTDTKPLVAMPAWVSMQTAA